MGSPIDRGALITEQAAEFRAALPEGGVLMGLDLGTRTIGTAFCDAGWNFASAGKTLPRGKFARDKAALEALIAERRVRGLVIGLPLNMDGGSGARAQASRAAKAQFCASIRSPARRTARRPPKPISARWCPTTS